MPAVIRRASMLSANLAGKSISDAKELTREFRLLLRGQHPGPTDALGELVALGPVAHNPHRVNCAAMACAAFEAIVEEHEAT